MLINLRNALMGGKRLPYDAEVEYLESSGTQYIDTGFKANTTTTRLDIELMLTQSTTNMGLFGSRNATGTLSSSSCNAFFLPANQAFRMDWASGGGPFFNCLPNTAYSISITRGSVTINGSTTTYTNTDSVDQENNFLIFSFAEGSGVVYQNGMIGRVFGAKIYSNGILVRDYIPVRRGAVGYLYDRVSGKLFGNAGTGDFQYGQDVVPVEWLRSSGSQWIDTGVVPAANDTYTVETRKLDARQDNASFGLAAVVYCFANPAGTFWCHPALGAGGRNGTNPLGNTNWHTIVASPTSVSVDGVALGDRTSDAQSPLSTVKLFARGNNSASGGVAKNYNGMISHVLVNRGGSDLRKFYSVRVGTEGAMMDVLTRRIYRNAGTGAFTYGNDLKYPIPSE